MLNSLHYPDPSIAYYAPYPGSALGYQLIAEGKSLMSKDNYHRYPGDEKVKGIDYTFYRDLLDGKYEDSVKNDSIKKTFEEKACLEGSTEEGKKEPENTRTSHGMYLFHMRNGKKKLSYGKSPEDALDILRIRLTDDEMDVVIPDQYKRIGRYDLIKYSDQLG